MSDCAGTTSWTDVLTAIGTVGAVLVALFVSFIPKLFPPKLQIQIKDAGGTSQRVRLLFDTGGAIPARSRDASARYYHVIVTNARRWTKAHNVQVLLFRLERQTESGWIETWAGGGIPLIWQHENETGIVRNVGPPALADLFHVIQDIDPTRAKWLELTPKFQPFGVELRYGDPCTLRVTLRAQSDEADSSELVVTIKWNCQWHDGKDEMSHHVKVVTGAAT